MNILVSAYACEPGRGSEGEIGWSIVRELAERHCVWVITRANNRAIHEAAFAEEGKPASLHFLYYDTPAWARWYKKGKRFFLIYYYLWQIGSFFALRRFLQGQKIDLVHHLTGGMDWMPSGVALLGLPFLWGPVGSEDIHPALLPALPLRTKMKEIFRKLVLLYGRELDPLVRLTGRKAAIILSHTPEHLPHRYQNKIQPYIQTGIHSVARLAREKESLDRGEPFTVIYAGELVHWKGSSFAVDAFLTFACGRPRVRLLVAGDGPLREQLQHRVQESGCSGQVSFLGKVPMAELVEKLRLGDVFIYPSYHHGLATVVLQAMLTGLPVVCLEGDAIGRTVRDECGITVPCRNGGNVISDLAEAITRLYDDESLRKKLALAARDTTLRKYSYGAIAAGYDQFYQNLVKEKE